MKADGTPGKSQRDDYNESVASGILATASILCVIALFDAIIRIREEKRHCTLEDFSHIHPSGKVGKDILVDR